MAARKPPKVIEVYRDEARKWRHKQISRNGKETGASEQGVVRRDYAIERALEVAGSFDVVVPVVFTDSRSGRRFDARTGLPA